MAAGNIKHILVNSYKNKWLGNISNITENPLLRTYNLFKFDYCLEPYLKFIKNYKHRVALSKFRCSSHYLEIERGRHTTPITPLHERLCTSCHTIDDELHFMIHCRNNDNFRRHLFNGIMKLYPLFLRWSPLEKFTFLMSSDDEMVLCMVGKFLHLSFESRRDASL